MSAFALILENDIDRCNLECVLVLHERTKTVQIPKIFFDLSTWIEFGSIFPIFSKMRAKADTTFYRRSKLRFGGGEKRLISCFYQPPPRAAKNALLEAETNHYKPWKSRLERVFCNIFDGFSRASVHSEPPGAHFLGNHSTGILVTTPDHGFLGLT